MISYRFRINELFVLTQRTESFLPEEYMIMVCTIHKQSVDFLVRDPSFSEEPISLRVAQVYRFNKGSTISIQKIHADHVSLNIELSELASITTHTHAHS